MKTIQNKWWYKIWWWSKNLLCKFLWISISLGAVILCIPPHDTPSLTEARERNMRRCYEIPCERMKFTYTEMEESFPRLFHLYQHLIPAYQQAVKHIQSHIRDKQIPVMLVDAEIKRSIGKESGPDSDYLFLEFEYVEDGSQVQGYLLTCETLDFSYEVSDFVHSRVYCIRTLTTMVENHATDGWDTRSLFRFCPYRGSELDEKKVNEMIEYLSDPIHRVCYEPLGVRVASVMSFREPINENTQPVIRRQAEDYGEIVCTGKLPSDIQSLSELNLRLQLRLADGTLTSPISVWINPVEFNK